MRIPLARLIRRTGTNRNTFTIRTPEPLARDRDRLLKPYVKVVRHWEGARARIVAAYERELGLYTRDSQLAGGATLVADAPSDLNDAIDSEGSWFSRIFVELRAEITDWALACEAWHRGKWRGALLSATGVDLDTMLYAGDVAQTIDASIAGNLALIKDVNDQQAARMKEAVFRGLNQRLPARDVARELQSVTGFGRKRANLISSVELMKISTALDTERQYQAGITQFEWRHSKKLHPRPWHAARDGKIYYLESRKQVDGDEMIPADDMPGIPIRCGCRKQAHLDLNAMEAELDKQGL